VSSGDSPAFAAVRWVWEVLDRAGTTWLVGGAVRDRLLGLEPHDWDFATVLDPKRVVAVLRPRGVPVDASWARYGRVGVITCAGTVDVVTFRAEGDYLDRRRPRRVQWIRRGEVDLLRRDFTVNALALTRAGRVVDVTGGQADLARRRLRTVGPAPERLRQDPLRVWRAVRFLAYAPGDWRWDAALEAAVRVGRELAALMERPYPSRALRAAGAFGLLPPWPAERRLCHLDDPALRWAAVEQTFGRPGWTAGLGLPRPLVRAVAALRAALDGDERTAAPPDRVARLAAWLGRPVPRRLPPLPISGRDVMERLGIGSGPAVGAVLRRVRAWAASQPVPPDREAILAYLDQVGRSARDE
jgi:hypothetical protein